MAPDPFGPYIFKPTLFPVPGFNDDDDGESTEPDNVDSATRQLKEANEKVAVLQRELEGAQKRAQDRFIQFKQANARAERAEKTIDALKFDWEDRELKHKRALLAVRSTMAEVEEELANEKNAHEATKATLRMSQEHIGFIQRNMTVDKEKHDRVRHRVAQLESEVQALTDGIQSVRRARDEWQNKFRMLLQARQPTPTRQVQAVPLGSSPEQMNKKRKLEHEYGEAPEDQSQRLTYASFFTSMNPQRQSSTLNGRSQYGNVVPDGQNMQLPSLMRLHQSPITTGFSSPMSQNRIGSSPSPHQPRSIGTTWPKPPMQSKNAPFQSPTHQTGTPAQGKDEQLTLDRSMTPAGKARNAPIQAALPTPRKTASTVRNTRPKPSVACTNCRGNFWEDHCDDDEPCRNCTVTGSRCERKKCQNYDQGACSKRNCKDAHRDGHLYKNLGEYKRGARFLKKKDATPSPVEMALAAAESQPGSAASSAVASPAAPVGTVNAPSGERGDGNFDLA